VRTSKAHVLTHETARPWPLHFKHSHWWKRQSQSKFASHHAWGTDGVCECKMMDVKSTWIPTWHQMEHVSWSLGLFSNTTTWREAQHKTRGPWHSEHSQQLINSIVSCVRTHMNRIHWISIWLKARSHMTPRTLHLRVCDHTTWFWRCFGTAFGHFLLGSHNSHGHGSWLVCEVALRATSHLEAGPIHCVRGLKS
jgi:hypothetical protein